MSSHLSLRRIPIPFLPYPTLLSLQTRSPCVRVQSLSPPLQSQSANKVPGKPLIFHTTVNAYANTRALVASVMPPRAHTIASSSASTVLPMVCPAIELVTAAPSALAMAPYVHVLIADSSFVRQHLAMAVHADVSTRMIEARMECIVASTWTEYIEG